MEDDGVVVAALGKGGEVGAGLRGGLLVGLNGREKRHGHQWSVAGTLRTLGAWFV